MVTRTGKVENMDKRIVIIMLATLFLCQVASPDSAFAKQQTAISTGKENRAQNGSHGIAGSLSCWAYGYRVRILINGSDVGITGGKSESRRLFSSGHEMLMSPSAEASKGSFVLRPGGNLVAIEFSRLPDRKDDRLEVSLEVEGYPAPLLFLRTRSNLPGRIEKTVAIDRAAPDGFKPLLITDEGDERSVLVHLSTVNCSLTPTLNGKEGMTISGLPGSVLLDGIRPGENQLSIKYSGEADKEMKFAIITPEWTRFLVRKAEDCSEKGESFTFIAK